MHDRTGPIIAAAVFIGATSITAVRTQPIQTPVPAGVWGGKGIQLTVTRSGASLVYDCASGSIDEPLLADASGHFIARGKHTFGRGGPRRTGEARPKAHVARYDGRWDAGAGTIDLSVTLTDLGRTLDHLKVGLGRTATLERCG